MGRFLVVFLLYLTLTIVILVFIYVKRPTKLLLDAYTQAENETRWEPAYFLIYDNSTIDECNRFIHIFPFNWYVWAIQNQVYIIENTQGIICSTGTIPAIKVSEDPANFVHVCLSVTLDGIIGQYLEAPFKIFYDITESSQTNKFTVLDALNILFERYITISFYETNFNFRDLILGINENEPTLKVDKLKLSSFSRLKESTLGDVWKRFRSTEANRTDIK